MSPINQRHRNGLWWAFLGVVAFSFSLPMTKLALEGFDPFVISMGRAATAGIIAAVALRIRRVPLPPASSRKPIFYTTLGAVFGWPIFIGLALQRTTSAHAAVMVAVMPAVTAAFAVLRHKERTSPRFWVGVSFSTLCVVAFAVSRGGGLATDALADVLIALAIVSSSLCYVEGAGLTAVMPGWQVISWVVAASLPITLPATIALWWLSGADLPTSASPWWGMAYLSVFSMYLGFFAWYRGLAMAGVARGSQVQQLQGVLTLGWSVWLLHERVSWVTAVAAIGVLLGVSWTQSSRFATSHPVGAPEE